MFAAPALVATAAPAAAAGAGIAGMAGLAALGPVGLAIGIASLGAKVLGGIFGANSAKRAAKQRAQLLEEGARQDLAESGIAAQVALDQGARLQGQAATLMASSGAGATLDGGGSALNVLDDLSRQSTYNARAAIYQGQTAARAKRLEAKATIKAGAQAQLSGLIGAGSSLIGGFGSLYEQGQQMSLSRSGGL